MPFTNFTTYLWHWAQFKFFLRPHPFIRYLEIVRLKISLNDQKENCSLHCIRPVLFQNQLIALDWKLCRGIQKSSLSNFFSAFSRNRCQVVLNLDNIFHAEMKIKKLVHIVHLTFFNLSLHYLLLVFGICEERLMYIIFYFLFFSIKICGNLELIILSGYIVVRQCDICSTREKRTAGVSSYSPLPHF